MMTKKAAVSAFTALLLAMTATSAPAGERNPGRPTVSAQVSSRHISSGQTVAGPNTLGRTLSGQGHWRHRPYGHRISGNDRQGHHGGRFSAGPDGRHQHAQDRRGRARFDHGRSFAGDRYKASAHDDIIGIDGLPSVVEGVGTFAGGLSAVRIPGNGLYIASNVPLGRDRGTGGRAPRAKIISIGEDVAQNRFLPREACEYEAGVCIIRGSR